MPKITTFKKGVTSIYVVVFTTLLLGIITVSFIGLVITEMARTNESKLAQSAYDSALAGVEDAKLAIVAYHNCLGQDDQNQTLPGQVLPCKDIKKIMETQDCTMVAKALGRTINEKDGNSEVFIRETQEGTIASNETTQAYTCVIVNENIPDYRAFLSSDTPTRIIPLKSSQLENVKGIRISWYSENYGSEYSFTNVNNKGSVQFQPLMNGTKAATPPTISAQIIQTDTLFTLEDFISRSGNNTNRGTVFLTPTNKNPENTKYGIISASKGFLSGNDRSTQNVSHTVLCNNEDEFACSVALELPKPIQRSDSEAVKDRNSDSALLILSLPYGQPDTDFSVELCIDKGDGTDGNCLNKKNQKIANEDCVASADNTTACFNGAQSRVDSTGRANDLYSRVDTRIELSDLYFPFPDTALQMRGDNGVAVDKNFWVTIKDCRAYENGKLTTCQPSKAPK